MLLRRDILSACLPAGLAACGPPAEPPPVSLPGEKRFLRPPLLEIEAQREFLPDPATGHTRLRLSGEVRSQEQIIELRDLRLLAFLVGRHRPDPERPEVAGQWRMLARLEQTVRLDPGQRHAFATPILESGEGERTHPNFGIAYQGYLVRVENAYGELAAEVTSDSRFPARVAEWRLLAEGEDFLP
jgi:hypothetical protein